MSIASTITIQQSEYNELHLAKAERDDLRAKLDASVPAADVRPLVKAAMNTCHGGQAGSLWKAVEEFVAKHPNLFTNI